MAKHSFAYGVFTVGRYKSGPSIHKIYVKDARGRFVGGALRKQVLSDVFRPKKMWRMTIGHDWVVHGEYECVKIQAWDRSKIKLRARRVLEGWNDKVKKKSAETIFEEHGDIYRDYIKEGGGWKRLADPWFDFGGWVVDMELEQVPLDKKLIGKSEGPRSEKL